MIRAQEWIRVENTPPLRADEVHLWRARLDFPGDAEGFIQECLSDEERNRAERFIFPVHRQRFILAHALTRMILAGYLGTKPSALQFGVTEQGKPFLSPKTALDVRFNLSHSGDLFTLAVTAQREIGVDIEIQKGELPWREIASGFYAPVELAWLDGLEKEPAAQSAGFYRIWTFKEAYLKAVGKGLPGGLDQAIVDTSYGGTGGFSELPGGENEKHRWEVIGIEPASGAFGAVVFERAKSEARLLALEPGARLWNHV
jgi:4'-phosphopantetheinyl transferase